MSFVAAVLKRPYTVVAVLILVCLLGIGAALRMPVDIFPEIDIPVVSVVWTYNGMSAEDIQNRILTLHERQLASLVDDISRIEATSYQGVGVEKVYLHEGADVTRAVSQLASSALVVLKYMPPQHHAAAGAALRRDRRADHPAQPVERHAARHQAQRPRPEHHPPGARGRPRRRGALSVRRQAARHHGRPRLAGADRRAGLSPADVSTALQSQNVILPSGDVKIGDKRLHAVDEQQPRRDRGDQRISRSSRSAASTVFMRDVAHVHDGFQVQTNSVSVDGKPGALMVIRKTGGVSTLAVIDGVRAALPDIGKMLPHGRVDQGDLRPVGVRQGGAATAC